MFAIELFLIVFCSLCWLVTPASKLEAKVPQDIMVDLLELLEEPPADPVEVMPALPPATLLDIPLDFPSQPEVDVVYTEEPEEALVTNGFGQSLNELTLGDLRAYANDLGIANANRKGKPRLLADLARVLEANG